MQKISDQTILATGIPAWLLLAFASTKLAAIYAPNPFLAYLLSYNISAILLLLYFIGYFKERFGLWYLILLIVVYNAGINILNITYNRLFLLEQPPMEIKRGIASAGSNLIVMFSTWLFLLWFIRKKK